MIAPTELAKITKQHQDELYTATHARIRKRMVEAAEAGQSEVNIAYGAREHRHVLGTCISALAKNGYGTTRKREDEDSYACYVISWDTALKVLNSMTSS